jgi:hypothetical protein
LHSICIRDFPPQQYSDGGKATYLATLLTFDLTVKPECSLSRMTRTDFDRDLRVLLAQQAKNFPANVQLTPFWADKHPSTFSKGHPLAARLVIVGFNPSSSVSTPWMDFWHPQTGFNTGEFQKQRDKEVEQYNRTRSPQQKKKRSISKTRNKIYQLVKEVCSKGTFVNTNIYWVSSPRAKQLARQHKTRAPLQWLLKRIPRNAVIVVHGEGAKKTYRKLRITYRDPTSLIFAPHFAVISNQAFKELKREVILRVSATQVKAAACHHSPGPCKSQARVPPMQSYNRLTTPLSGSAIRLIGKSPNPTYRRRFRLL